MFVGLYKLFQRSLDLWQPLGEKWGRLWAGRRSVAGEDKLENVLLE